MTYLTEVRSKYGVKPGTPGWDAAMKINELDSATVEQISAAGLSLSLERGLARRYGKLSRSGHYCAHVLLGERPAGCRYKSSGYPCHPPSADHIQLRYKSSTGQYTLISQPYLELDEEAVLDQLSWSRQWGLSFTVLPAGSHYPGGTIAIAYGLKVNPDALPF